MTDRINGVYVAFDSEVRIDDAEHMINAIQMVKGVSRVDAFEPINPAVWAAKAQLRNEILGTVIKNIEGDD